MQQELPGFEEPNTKASAETSAKPSPKTAATENTTAKESAVEQASIRSLLGELDASKHAQLILTPNQPLAQQLRRLRLESLQKNVAPASPIQVFSTWLNESVSENAVEPIANDVQLRWLMEQALAKSQAKHPYLHAKHLAPQALAAWRYLKRYEVPHEKLKESEIGQEAYFSETVECFDQLLKQKGLTTLEQEIQRQLDGDAVVSVQRKQASLYAFLDTPPPLFQQWLEHCFERIQLVDYSQTSGTSYLWRGTEEAEELKAAARWANTTLSSNPQARIGIIHSGLGADLLRTERLVRSQLVDTHAISSALKPPASDIGAVQSALGLLQTNRYKLTIAQARFVIHSPFWGDENDYRVRADWDTATCDTQQRHLTSASLRECIDHQMSDQHSALSKRLIASDDIRRRADKLQTPEQWAALFCRQLDALGWPRTANEQSVHESESARQLWLDLLRDFSTCGTVAPELALGDALTLLQQVCDRQRTDPGAAHVGVRLLDTVEAAADYTHLWMIGVDHTQWPASPTPNPLLPLRLQRKYGMPGADRSIETTVARQLLERLNHAAQEVVFSYSEQSEGVSLSASRLLPDDMQALDLPTLKQDQATPNYDVEWGSERRCEWIDTRNAPPLAEHERQVRGGAALFQYMAASPFSAFAIWRLDATPLEDTKIGLDARDRGNLVHYMMEAVWKRIESHADLIALDDDSRTTLCLEAAESALRTWQSRGLSTTNALPSALVQLETTRLSRLAMQWLNLEAERSPFQVEAIEQRMSAALGPLSFQLRIDRIDRLQDGSLMLLDYKTSKQLSVKKWTEDPPSEPQLPLYAISLPEPPAAIAFAQLASTSTALIGLGSAGAEDGERNENRDGIATSEDWQAQLDTWRESLSELAESYANGDAWVCMTKDSFGQRDPLIPLHRSPEREALMALTEKTLDTES